MADIRNSIDEIFIRGDVSQTTTSESYTLTTAGQEYPLNQNTALNGAAKHIDDSSGYSFTCTDGSRVDFHGNANVSVDKACTLTFILYVNGVEIVSTPVGFTASTLAVPVQFSAGKAFIANNGDVIEFKAKSSASSTTITILNFDAEFEGWLAPV